MGGGGGYGPSKDQLERLEELAKETLRKGDTTPTRNVFISFVREDLNDVNLLRAQAKNEDSAIEFNDWSLREPFNSKRGEYIRKGIRERIERSSVTLVYLSDKTASSKWVDWEVRESLRLGKVVIAVYKGESPPRNLPSSIKDYKVPLTRWSEKGIAVAISKAAKVREDTIKKE